MSNTNNGGPAFPNQHTFEAWTKYESGMSLRDYFAAKAMQAEMADPEWHIEAEDWTVEVAAIAYRMADAMLAAREAKQ